MIYYTADLHFGHANVIRHCDRPFSDADALVLSQLCYCKFDNLVMGDEPVYLKELITDPDGYNLSRRNITVSTCGIADKIRDVIIRGDVMGSDHCPVTLDIDL